MHAFVEDPALALAVSRVRAEIAAVDRALDREALEERLITALNLVGRDLAGWARELQLEHGDRNVGLDRRHLTIAADTVSGPLPLSQIGSGENWVGYHVATHLALHALFRARRRPGPGFLMLDQPSQGHYPRDRDVGEIAGVDDGDQVAVARLYRLLWEYCDSLVPDMQIIVTDHVDLMQDWFQSSVRQRWRDGIKPVPTPWLNALDQAVRRVHRRWPERFMYEHRATGQQQSTPFHVRDLVTIFDRRVFKSRLCAAGIEPLGSR